METIKQNEFNTGDGRLTVAGFLQLWMKMHRGLKEINDVLLRTGQARRMFEARSRTQDGGPEYIALAENLAQALDAQSEHFDTLRKVSGQLASFVYESATDCKVAAQAMPVRPTDAALMN